MLLPGVLQVGRNWALRARVGHVSRLSLSADRWAERVTLTEHLGYERGKAPPGGVGKARNSISDAATIATGARDQAVATTLRPVGGRLRHGSRRRRSESLDPARARPWRASRLG